MISAMRYKAAIFDMDGTILETLEDLTDAVNYAVASCGYPTHTIEEVRFFVGNGMRVLIDRAVPQGTNQEGKDRVFQAFRAYYKVHGQDKTKPYPGVIALLQNLRAAGIKTAVVSNKAHSAVVDLTEAIFPGLFDVAMGENESAGIPKKPAPEMTWRAMELLGVSREESVYIGDSDVDIATARNAGLDEILVSYGFRGRALLEEYGAKCICDTTDEVERILLGE